MKNRLSNHTVVNNYAEHGQCGSSALNPWYLLKTKPCQEDRAKYFISLMGIKVLLPLYTSNSKPRPLFPGYMFATFSLDLFSKVNNAFGMRKIVRFGGEPATVPATIVEELYDKMDSAGCVELLPQFSAERFKSGDLVAVCRGPFRGWYGVFDHEITGKDRVKILLDTLNFTRGFQQQAHGVSISVEVSKFDLMLA